MKRPLILSIVAVALTLLAIATPADAAPCEPFDREIVAARAAINSAKADLKLAEQKQTGHKLLFHTIGSLSRDPKEYQEPICTTCMENYYAINQAKAAIRAAEKERDRAQRVHDTCIASYSCSNCNQLGDDHYLRPQPGCRHNVYSCQSDAGTHTQVVCGGCNATYWSCGNTWQTHHVQVTCGPLVRYTPSYRSYPGCGQKYWHCATGGSGHGIKWDGTRACTGSRVINTNSPTSGTTTSPTVQNNGGSVSSGSGSGSSSDRVRCGNAGNSRRSCDKGGYASSTYAHYSATCTHRRGNVVTYWSCDATARRYHARHQ